MSQNEISVFEPNIDQIARFQSLQTGQYWRSLQDIAKQGIDAGEVLLIQSIRWVDDAPHTIILRPHPSKFGKNVELKYKDDEGKERRTFFTYDEHRFLLNDFLTQFEYEPDHQRVRNEEVRQLQGRINGLQAELLEAQSNPSVLANVVDSELREEASKAAESKLARLPLATASDQKGKNEPEAQPADSASLPALPGNDLVSMATGTVANAINAGITEAGIAALKAAAGREHQIATIKSKWIQAKTSQIAATIKAMTPFYEEQAAAALAQTEDVRTYVAKLMKGIESLDLYVGKDVIVQTIREGDSAAKDVPLTFVQKKLMMDEELAVWADLDDWFDFSKADLFFEALRQHDDLVEQIFPTERCVLVMASTRRYIDYGDKWSNMEKNAQNQCVFLLVRNGMNLYRVFSSVESHLGTARLFPSKNDQEAIFRGYDGSTIKFEDVAYTDKLAAHEKYALHYKRFLLLVCGLDHRLKLFGDFYEGPQSFHFVSMAFQEQYCRFLHDDDGEGMLPSAECPMPLNDWIKEKNTYLRSGSRVLCNWGSIMTPHTAPGACKERPRSSGFDQDYYPTNKMDTVIAFREGTSVCVEIGVASQYSWRDRTFNCKVNLSKYKPDYYERNELAYLCLDAVRAEDLRWYIHNRKTRGDHIFYIRFFKTALKFIQQERQEERATRQRLAQALMDGRIATGPEAEEIIDQAVIAWRAANRGKPLPAFNIDGSAPPAWKSLLDQMFMLAGEGQRQTAEVEAFVHTLGYQPIRLVLSGGAKLVVYVAPRQEERDDRLTPHVWVHRISLERGKTKMVEKSRRWTMLPKAAASETTLHQWEGADEWVCEESVFQTFERKQQIFAIAEKGKELLADFSGPMNAEIFSKHSFDWKLLRDHMLDGAKYVRNPTMALPFGLVYWPRTKEVRFLCIGSHAPHALLYRLAPNEEARQDIRQSFIRSYGRKEHARKTFDSDLNSAPWCLMEMTISLSQSKIDVFAHEDVSWYGLDCKPVADPLLSSWFERWQKDNTTHASFWIDAEMLGADGRLLLDNMLGVQRPDDYDPRRVYQITLAPLNKDERPKLYQWFDICPHQPDFEKPSRGIWQSGPDLKDIGLVPDGTNGYSTTSLSSVSPSAARASIEAQVRTESPNMMAVPATSIPGATLPPEGFERWYVVEKNTVTTDE